MKNLIFVLIAISIFTSCSSSVETTKTEIPSELSHITAVSQTKKISVNKPANWNSILDNKETVFDVWFVSPEKNAVIGFIPLSLNKELDINDDEDSINLLTKFSMESKKSQGAVFESNDEIPMDEINGFYYSELKYYQDGRSFNSVIFGKDNIYYECLAYFEKDYNPTDEEFEKLVNLQKLTIQSAKTNK